ncbi:MAG: hypothetical protein PHH75_01300 [Candidatus Omnitrophica bacterium]|nr:hypothetical protein [Candidatus Omnitrophota bacterium]MDD5573794.1 hypothetical protein [Candidatus Omnitrophota bacterium]
MQGITLKNLNPRARAYAAILLFGLMAVFVRIALVQLDRGRQIVSFVSEWERNGKPVVVKEMAAVDVPVYTKFTVIIGQDGSGAGFVTGDIKDKLAQGQAVYATADGGIPCGAISEIGQELDMDTGMFPVTVGFSNFSGASGSRPVLFAQTQTLVSAFVAPNDIIDISKDGSYVWIVEEGKAKKINVRIGSRNGYGTLIVEGVESGDLVVLRGQDLLEGDDKVNIVGRETGSVYRKRI